MNSFYKKFKKKLSFFFSKFYKKKNKNFYEQIEEILIKYGVGIKTTNKIIYNIKNKKPSHSYSDLISIKKLIKEEFNIIFNKIPIYKEDDLIKEINIFPYIFNIIGINGVGKTTVIGKLLYRFKKKKFNILVSAADTFRAAAISQLEILCKKSKINIFKENESNPSSVVYNSIKYAKSKKIDIVFIDTSGRLHNNKNLLNELKKINNITKKLTNNSFKNFLILDGTSGNIVFDQIKNFLNYIPIHFIILTKFDLTKKWGIVIGIYDQFNIPILYISDGEKIKNLYEFNKKKLFSFF